MIADTRAIRDRQRRAPQSQSALPPVVLLGGDANALSAARSLGRRGIRVYAIIEGDSCVTHSRYCHPIILSGHDSFADRCTGFLLSSDAEFLAGAVLLAFSDATVQMLTHYRRQLLQRYKLDLSNPTAQMAMLNKLDTYRAAVAAGVPTPCVWTADSRAQVLALREQLVFPLIVKPLFAHKSNKHFGHKHTRVSSFPELLEALEAERAAGVEVLLMECIPGPDDLLCSYYTYVDEAGTPLFDYTKRVIRRFPPGMGLGCYHITDWVPGIIEPSRRLVQHVGLRGLANVEFKLDPRDGQYKLIECNARFTATTSLITASGFDLPAFVYNRIVGLPQAPLVKFQRGLRVWDPALDVLSFLSLRRRGQLTFPAWVKSLLHHQTFAYFAWSDPVPALVRAMKLVKLLFKRRQIQAAQTPLPSAPPAPVLVETS